MTTAATAWATSNPSVSPGATVRAAIAAATITLATWAAAWGTGTPGTPPVVMQSADAVSTSAVRPLPAVEVTEGGTSTPSYYSFRWDEVCQEECPARAVTD